MIWGAKASQAPARWDWLTAPATTRGLYFGLLALMTAPDLAFSVPRTSDIINHWARLTVLAAPASDPLQALYQVEWGLIPNLGIDLLYVALAPISSAQSVARLAFALAFWLPALGAWALHRAWSRDESPSPTILLVPVLSYNLITTIGLVNFGFGAGLALLALAWRTSRAGRHGIVDIVGLNLIAVALFFCHLLAFVAFAALLALLEVTPQPGETWVGGWRRALATPVYVAAGLVLAAMMPPLPHAFAFAGQKAQLLAAPFEARHISDLWLVVDMIGLLGWLIARRALVLAASARWLVFGFGVLAALAPPSQGATVLIDARLMVVWVYLALAACRPRDEDAAAMNLVVPAAALLGLLRVGAIWPAWDDFDARTAELREAFRSIPQGSRVLAVAPTVCGDFNLALYNNLATFAVIDRHSAVNLLFANRGMQPIRTRDAALEEAPELALSDDWLDDRFPSFPGIEPYRHWRDHFDVVVDMHGDCADGVAAPELEQVASSRIADVFRLKQP